MVNILMKELVVLLYVGFCLEPQKPNVLVVLKVSALRKERVNPVLRRLL